MTYMPLQLGYKVRRAKLDGCDELYVHSYDLDLFCIPVQYASRLAEAYKNYLIAAGILDWENDPLQDEQEVICNQHSLEFYHERDKSKFVIGEFHLGAAVEMIYFSSKLPQELVIRWCMMMEYITWEDQRREERQEVKDNTIPAVSIDEDDQIVAA